MLRILLFLPLLGAGVILFLPPQAPGLIRATATLAAVATVVFATVLVLQFDATQTGVQFFETHTWNPRLGTSFSLGLDGLSAPMVLLAALPCLVAVLASGNIRERAKGYYLLLLSHCRAGRAGGHGDRSRLLHGALPARLFRPGNKSSTEGSGGFKAA